MPDLQPGIARQHATTNVPAAQAEQTVEELREELTSRRFDYAGDVAVLDGNTLAGLLSIERLLAAEEAPASQT
jgi:magnesium transporter